MTRALAVEHISVVMLDDVGAHRCTYPVVHAQHALTCQSTAAPCSINNGITTLWPKKAVAASGVTSCVCVGDEDMVYDVAAIECRCKIRITDT